MLPMRSSANPAFSPQELRRALVIKLRHHGDVLLATPVLSMLKRIAPQCEVDALIYADTAPMFDRHPALAQLHLIDRNWKRQGLKNQTAAEWRLLSQLRARHYDLVVHLSVHTRGAWLTRLLRPRWSVAPRTGSVRGEKFWNGSFTHFYAAQSHALRHTVDTNLDSLRALGQEPTPEDARVTLVPGAAAEQRVDALLAGRGLLPQRFIHIHPASRWGFKCWPAEYVGELCDVLAAQGWPIVLTSSPDPKEKALIADVLAVSRAPTFDLSGQLSLKELAALTARGRLFVGVDSAPMHMAAAMGTPTVAIFGPSGDREWGPWNVASRVVTSLTHDCRPCGRAGCNDSKISECLTTLPVAQVLQACEELLA
jgi:heptosyltransferase III